MRNWTILGGVVVALIILGAIGANHPNPERSTSASQPIEYQLAFVDSGGTPDDVTVNRFRSLLRQLVDKYSEDTQQIGDQTVGARDLLKQKGVIESLLNIMEGMNQILPDGVHNQQYAGMLTMYVTLRDKGSSHSEAVTSLRDVSTALLNSTRK